MIPQLPESDCRELIPLVRARYRESLFGTKMDVVCVTDNEILVGRCSPEKNVLLDDPDAATLEARLKRVKKYPFSEIREVDVHPGGLRTRMTSIRIRTDQGKMRLKIPVGESEHLIGVLNSRLGDKFQFHNRVRMHGLGLNLFILFVLASAVATLVFVPNAFWLSLVFLGAVTPLLAVQIYDHIPAPLPWDTKPKKKSPGRDRSGKKPFRSKILGWTLKIVAATLLLPMWFIGIILFGLNSLFLILPSAPLILILYLGHQLTLVPPTLVRESDKRPPILFLRSFLDDRQTTLMPESRYARFMGVQPPRYLPSPWRYIFQFNPIRVFRIFFGLGVDRSEQELALFFREHGPFVSIGKPGERFATPGASRMYVNNSEWKDVVLEHLRISRFVVLQPGNTEGVWWEVENTLQIVDPQKILFCMVNFHRKQNDYEKFRLRAEKSLTKPLPRNLGYGRAPTFIYFGPDWTPYVQEVSCHSPFWWPIIGEPIDLEFTLEPFLNSSKSNTVNRLDAHESAEEVSMTALEDDRIQDASSPREPRGLSSAGRKSAAIVYGILVVVIGIGIASISSGTGANADQETQIYDRDRIAQMEMQQPSAALVARELSDSDVDAILASPPADAAGWKQRGLFQIQRQNFTDAVEDLTISLQQDDLDAETHFYRGEALMSLQQWEGAIRDYRNAVELDPDFAVAWNNLGYSLAELDNAKEAIESYTTAIELNPKSAQSFSNRGIAYLDAGETDKSIADFEQSLKLDSQQSILYYFYGQALAQKGLSLEAIKYFNTALELDPEIVDAYLQRAWAFVAIGKQKTAEFNPYDFARRDLNEILTRSPDNLQILLDRAVVNQLDGHLNDSIADTSEVLKKIPDQVRALAVRGETYFKLGKFNKALVDYDDLVRLQPENPESRLRRAGVLNSLKRYDEAVADTDIVVKGNPDNVVALHVQGNSLYFLGRYSETLENHDRVLKLQPQNRISLTMRAQVFGNRGEYNLAAAEYQKLADAQPDNFDAALCLTYALAKQQKWDRFETQKNALFESFSQHPNPIFKLFLARISLLQADSESVDWVQHIKGLKELANASPQAHAFALTLGAYQTEAGQLKEAIITLQAILETNANQITHAAARIWLSIAQAGMKQNKAARKTLEAATKWIAKECPLTVSEGEPIPDAGQWWERVEIHAWKNKAESVLNKLE